MPETLQAPANVHAIEARVYGRSEPVTPHIVICRARMRQDGHLWRLRGVGSRKAEIEAFVRERAPALLRAANALTGDPTEAQDLVQHALLQVWRHWTRVRCATDPGAYVNRVLVNAHLSERRRARWQRERLTSAPPERATVVEEAGLPYELIRALPHRQRAALVLRYVADLDDAAIAGALGCTESTVRTHVSRARSALRTQLTEVPDAR